MGVVLRAPNTDLLVSGKPKTFISVAVASASSTPTAESIANFSVGDELIIGQIGEERTEMARVHVSTAPSGSTITLNANTSYRHENGVPIFFCDYDRVEFSRATTATGTKTVLTTITITPDQMETIYDDSANSTGFGFYRFAKQITITSLTSASTTATATSAGHGFVTGDSITISGADQSEYNGTYTVTVTSASVFTYTFAGSATTPATGTIIAKKFSSYSDAIPYAGYAIDATATILDRALNIAGAAISPKLRYEHLYKFLNDFVAFANSKSIRWSERKVLNYELDTIATGDWEFALPSDIVRASDPSAIIGLHIRGYAPLAYRQQSDWNLIVNDLIYTTVSTAITAVDTEIVLTNSKGFADSGNIEIEGDVIAYTGNTRSSNTLTGVTGIATTHAVGTYAFQGNSNSEPTYYSVPSSGYVRVFPICGSSINNRVLYLDYYSKIPTVDGLGDRIGITDIQPAVDYVAYRIKKHLAGGSLATTDEDFKLFVAQLDNSVSRDSTGQPIRVRTR